MLVASVEVGPCPCTARTRAITPSVDLRRNLFESAPPRADGPRPLPHLRDDARAIECAPLLRDPCPLPAVVSGTPSDTPDVLIDGSGGGSGVRDGGSLLRQAPAARINATAEPIMIRFMAPSLICGVPRHRGSRRSLVSHRLRSLLLLQWRCPSPKGRNCAHSVQGAQRSRVHSTTLVAILPGRRTHAVPSARATFVNALRTPPFPPRACRECRCAPIFAGRRRASLPFRKASRCADWQPVARTRPFSRKWPPR